ncbi:MAG: class I SAM-dependent methyltransferase [Candidatus Woesearchaeota archaeon]
MKSNKMKSRNNIKYFYNPKNNNSKNSGFKNNYYNTIAPGYDELYMEEQLKKLNLIKKTIDEENVLREFRNPKNLLDIGCGSGISTRFFANTFKIKNIMGIDPSKELLKIAKEKDPNGKYIICDAEQINHLQQIKKFDIIISITAIQNFHNINLALQNIKSLGKNFVLTFLKKSTKKEIIERNIKKTFFVIKRIEEDKDIIFFCKQKTQII